MLVRFWGVRGSSAVPGSLTERYGGNTSCISIDLTPSDTLIVDAGTGIRELGEAAKKERVDAAAHTYFILLSHLHWDHVQGIPLFAPFHDAKARIEFISDPELNWGRRVMKQFGGDHFPLCEDDLLATVVHREESPKAVLAPFLDDVERIRANHPGLCYGYRFRKGNKSLVYLTDNEVTGMPAPLTPREELVSFCKDVDFLIHDAQYTVLDLPRKCGWGHSEVSDVCRLAADANVGKLFLFHHDPNRSDNDIDGIVASARDYLSGNRSSVSCSAAREGDSFDL